MIDGSHLPYEENVALTKKVVEYAHQFGCLDSLRQLMGKVGIVAAFGGVGSVIFVRPAFGFQPRCV